VWLPNKGKMSHCTSELGAHRRLPVGTDAARERFYAPESLKALHETLLLESEGHDPCALVLQERSVTPSFVGGGDLSIWPANRLCAHDFG
jgi:hypothetical protein